MSSVTADSTAWWAESVAVVAARVRTDVEHGLTDGEAVLRLERDGANEIVERPPPAAWRALVSQFTGAVILVLLGAALVSAAIGDLKDTVVILAIVVLNALL